MAVRPPTAAAAAQSLATPAPAPQITQVPSAPPATPPAAAPYGATAAPAPSAGSPVITPVYTPSAAPTADLLARARDALANNRLTTPEDDNAVKWSRAVLELEPANAEARGMLQDTLGRYLDWAERELDRGQRYRAMDFLQRAAPLHEYASAAQTAKATDLRIRLREERPQVAARERFDDPPGYGRQDQRASQGAYGGRGDSLEAYSQYFQMAPTVIGNQQQYRQGPNPAQDLMRVLGR